MGPEGTTIRSSIEVNCSPQVAFERLVDELTWALDGAGYLVDFGPDGRIVSGALEVGSIVVWEPGNRIAFEWRPATWNSETTTVELQFEPTDDGTKITLAHHGWGKSIDDASGLVGWFATEIAAPHFVATAPEAFGDWLTDRGARRPSGESARDLYGDPLYHYPNFRVILEELALTPDDYLLEIGCGGGALLRLALKSGCRAAAVDHSPEMVRLATQTNRDAIDNERLDVWEADAADLPFSDETFTRATMTGVLGHLPNPIDVFEEMHRVLAEGGRIVVLGSDPELRGTDAAPEPMASRMQFYDSDALEGLARAGGFESVRVVRHDLESHARDVGVPDEHLPLFEVPARFLIARKHSTRP